MRARSGIAFLVFSLVMLAPLAALAGMGGENMLKQGSVAPDYKFVDIDGVEGSLHSIAKGKPLLVVFLQVTCRSCQREMAYLKELSDKGDMVDVLAFFVDPRKLDFKAYAKERDLPFRFVWDGDYSLAELYGVSFTPASFLLDSNRKVVKSYRGWTRAGKKMGADIKALQDAGK